MHAGIGESMNTVVNITVLVVAALLILGKILIKVKRYYGGRPTGGAPGADFKGTGGVYYGDGMKGIGGTYFGSDDKKDD